MAPVRSNNEPGFVEVEALIANKKPAAGQMASRPPHNVIVLFDNSLSMQWDKLERSYEAMEKVLHSLTPQDHFNLFLLNSKIAAFQPPLTTVTPATLHHPPHFIRTRR